MSRDSKLLTLEVGKTYDINHKRKGRFRARITHLEGDQATVEITSGEATGLTFIAGEGEELTVRTSFASWVLVALLALFAACGDNITAPDARPDPDALVVDAAPDAAPDAAELGACDVVCNDGTPIWSWACNASGCYCNSGFPDCVSPVDGGVP